MSTLYILFVNSELNFELFYIYMLIDGVLGYANGNISYIGLDSSTGEMVLITEWTLKWRDIKRKMKNEAATEDQQKQEKYSKLVSDIPLPSIYFYLRQKYILSCNDIIMFYALNVGSLY